MLPARLLRGLVVLGAALAFAGASAQEVEMVLFQPTARQYFDAFQGAGSEIAPEIVSDDIGYTISTYFSTAEVMVEGAPSTEFEIVGHYRSDNTGAVPRVVLSTTPQRVFRGFVWFGAELEVDYTLRLKGRAAPGTYDVTVTYRLVGANAISHLIRVVVPPVTALRQTGGAVEFDYASEAQAYMAALGGDGLLPPTAGTTLESVEAFANQGFTLSAEARQASGPTGGGIEAGDLLLRGTPLAASSRGLRTYPSRTQGFETVLTSDDYRLAVDGAEAAGEYGFEVTLTLATP